MPEPCPPEGLPLPLPACFMNAQQDVPGGSRLQDTSSEGQDMLAAVEDLSATVTVALSCPSQAPRDRGTEAGPAQHVRGDSWSPGPSWQRRETAHAESLRTAEDAHFLRCQPQSCHCPWGWQWRRPQCPVSGTPSLQWGIQLLTSQETQAPPDCHPHTWHLFSEPDHSHDCVCSSRASPNSISPKSPEVQGDF